MNMVVMYAVSVPPRLDEAIKMGRNARSGNALTARADLDISSSLLSLASLRPLIMKYTAMMNMRRIDISVRKCTDDLRTTTPTKRTRIATKTDDPE